MSIEVRRLFDFPYYQLEHFPKRDALTAKINGEWVPISTEAFIKQANEISRGLLQLGIQPGDRVAMISNNRPEWNIMDIGILQIGAVNVPVYPTISRKDYSYIFNDAEVKLCVVSSADLLEKVSDIQAEVPTLKAIYSFDQLDNAAHWTEIAALGTESDQEKVEQLMQKVKSEDLATLIYTSGTTGLPKGVMLSHKNITSNALSSMERLPVSKDGKALTFLPICHVYERMLHYLYMYAGVSIYFAESMDTIGDNLREVKPDVFTAVPRLLEKVYDRIMAKGSELTGIKQKLFYWAVALGEKYEPYGKNGWWYEFQLSIARKLIFTKWQEALGGKVKAVASGSAALQPRLARVFNAAGVPVMEGYGLTETSPVIAVNCYADRGMCIGTVGRPISGVEVKIAEDGEILVKGPNVMMGYYKNPTLTKEVLQEDGWFHTGDIGTMIDGQYLKITDRKKEIFKTSGGKYVAPQVLENKFKESAFIEQMMVVGENKKYPAALIVPNFPTVLEFLKRSGGDSENQPQELIKNPEVVRKIKQEVERYNEDFGQWEKIKRFELLPSEWTVENDELTPTLKLKRKKIFERYNDVIRRIYNE